MKIGIITGASSGLGREYARYIDKKMKLDEIWLVARREERLQVLAEQLQTSCRILLLDLAEKDSGKRLAEYLNIASTCPLPADSFSSASICENAQVSYEVSSRISALQVMILVNAAGFGKFGRAQDMSLEENYNMINVNCRAAVDFTKVCLPYMGRGSRILELCSCASFQPLQGLNLYAASKAFLTSYTRALRWEIGRYGIHATAVCPWWVKTEFSRVARETHNPDAVGHITGFAQHTGSVVSWSLFVNRLNLPVATCGPISLAMRVAGKIIPNGVIMAVWEILRRI